MSWRQYTLKVEKVKTVGVKNAKRLFIYVKMKYVSR